MIFRNKAHATDYLDTDTDDDGISDGIEDINHNGVVDSDETNPCLVDSDGDGIQDGTELGYTLADIGADTDTGVFIPDADSSTTTDPTDSDSDDDGYTDGQEDLNFNGSVDFGEADPLDESDVPLTGPVPTEEILPSDGASSNRFGYSTAISGDVALVGAYLDDDNGADSGAAYIFRWNGSNWVEEQKLLPSDGAADDYFGYSVSISGDVALVGTYLDDDNGADSGAAYIFRWNGSNWVEEQKLLPSDGAADDYFGLSVSISGNIALIGAYGDDDNGSSSGSAYIFRWNGSNWIEEQKLLASDGAGGDNFGRSVAMGGDVALVGAYGDDDNGSSSGSAYIFRWNGSNWIEEQKLLASDGADYDYFSYSVSISGNVVLVGTYNDDDNGSSSGSAYVFRWNGNIWEEEQKLFPSDGTESDRFGYSVSINGDVALIGAYLNDENSDNSGSAYVFRWNGTSWVEEQKLVASDGGTYDYFGYSVSISEYWALVGTWRNKVYVHLLSSLFYDLDGDGLFDDLEDGGCTNQLDADSDDDGLSDGIEDANHNGVVDVGETNPCDPDSDGDGIQDGTEKGISIGITDPDGAGPLLGTDTDVFIPDADPLSTTDPTNPDSDSDCHEDGEEDSKFKRNGRCRRN